MQKPKRIETASWLLYAASALGILELFTSSTIKNETPPLIILDIIVYGCLFILALIINKRIGIGRCLYTVLAIIWYVILVFFLPKYYNHDLNAGLVFIQVCITVVAILILYQPKSTRWFKSPKE